MTSARKTKRRSKKHKPRNPLVVPVMQRKAGAHRKSGKAKRQAHKRELEKADWESEA